jgi:site-specific DNA-methyltransferase (adenine-specific)
VELDTIYCGDCLQLLPQMDDDSVDMVLVDLPYGTTSCSWDSVISLESLWKELKRVIKKDDRALVFTASQPFASELVSSNKEGYRYSWYWNKRQD